MTTSQISENEERLVSTLEELKQVVAILSEGEESLSLVEAFEFPLESLRASSAETGFQELERAARGLRGYLSEELIPNPSVDSLTAFNFALTTLLDAVGADEIRNSASSFEASTVLGMLGISDNGGEESLPTEPSESLDEDSPSEAVQVDSEAIDFSTLTRIVGHLGGKLNVDPQQSEGASFHISFPATEANLHRINTLFSPLDTVSSFGNVLGDQDDRSSSLLDRIREFMQALTQGDMENSQDILNEIAEQQYQAGLYQEIGMMARDLHTSLKGFMSTLDPALKDIVEEKIPDSGNRLEHILKLTENAANTTLDNVERMQQTNQEDQKKLVRLGEILHQLKAIGEPAQGFLDRGRKILSELEKSAEEGHDTLITVLTAQDYQDLTGQVIMKIITLLKELERKLVGVISTFGVKLDGTGDVKAKDELYGPAHEHMTDALSSQDDVDALLADFGF